jgi:hypothetical protein
MLTILRVTFMYPLLVDLGREWGGIFAVGLAVDRTSVPNDASIICLIPEDC